MKEVQSMETQTSMLSHRPARGESQRQPGTAAGPNPAETAARDSEPRGETAPRSAGMRGWGGCGQQLLLPSTVKSSQ